MKRLPRSVWIFALLLAFVTSLPYIVGYISTPEGWRYSGTLALPSGTEVDYNSHLAKMWQGSRGEWDYHLLFTSEPHPGLPLVQGFYVALGALAHVTPFSLALIYQIARFLLTVGMVLAIWVFACRFFEKSSERWFTLIFGTVVIGWSWLLIIVAPSMVAEVSPIEFWLSDAFNLLGALYMPHFAAAVILQIVILLKFDEWVRLSDSDASQHRSIFIILILAMAAEAIIQPYIALMIVPLLGILTAYHIYSAHHLIFRRALWLLIPVAVHLALVAYQYIAINADPVWAQFAAQNQTLSPSVVYYLLGYLPFIIPITLGLRTFVLAQADDRWWLPLLWVAIVAALLYAPFPTERRYLLGIQTPLAVMASYGWSRAVLPFLKPSRRFVLSTVYFVLGAIAMIAVILLNTIALSQPSNHPELYDQPDAILGYDWLQQNTSPNDLVFTTFQGSGNGRGNRLVGATGHRVYIGHWIETVDYDGKVADLQQFYDAATSDDWRRDFLKRIGAAYIWYDEYAQHFGNWNPASADYLTAVFRSGTVTIWKVN